MHLSLTSVVGQAKRRNASRQKIDEIRRRLGPVGAHVAIIQQPQTRIQVGEIASQVECAQNQRMLEVTLDRIKRELSANSVLVNDTWPYVSSLKAHAKMVCNFGHI